VPDPSLNPTTHPNGGAYRPTPVKRVLTIMDRLDAAHRTWKLYTGGGGSDLSYLWAICPTFADCLYTSQARNMVKTSQFIRDASAGTLPNFSVLLPGGSATADTSQHNGDSMTVGDNWIGQAVSAVENGPDWKSTALFIAYDDCGCFYDHVAPPTKLGIRVPMVLVSPYARRGFTDSTVASFSSMMAFTEHTFGLRPLTSADGNAYDYSNAFNYSQAPLPAVPMVQRPLAPGEAADLAAHPPAPDST
jgi:phospholipase C